MATTPSPPYRICLVGSGGVGTIASLVLTKSKQALVTVVLRSTYEHVAAHGWDVDSVDHGKLTGWRPHRVVQSVEEAATEVDDTAAKITYDYVVVCTKQLPDRQPVPAMIAPVVTPGTTTVVLIQNGIGIEEAVLAAWPGNAVMSSVSHIGSRVEAPNRVTQTGPDNSAMGVHLGPDEAHGGLAAAEATRRARAFVGMYQAGGAHRCAWADDIQAARWEKLLWNGTFNTVCALTRASVGQVQRSRARETLLLPMMWEIWRVARAAGHGLPAPVVPWMAYRLSDTHTYRPSMLLDLEHGRPMELEVILANALRQAARLGVPMPVCDTVYKLLQVEQWKICGEEDVPMPVVVPAPEEAEPGAQEGKDSPSLFK